MSNGFRQLPSVDRLLQEPLLQAAQERYSRTLVLEATRQALEEVRARIVQGGPAASSEELVQAVEGRLRAEARLSLRPVINATGVIIHTNLGRAPLSAETVAAMAQAATTYCNLEYELEGGERGSRHTHLDTLLQELTGAEAGLVVNNNAGALLLCLAGLAKGKEVVVSRGQAVEIGGGFRIPDVLRQSGARLVEVGTTNRTYLADYEVAIGPRTALLLRVHISNFRLVGFTHTVDIQELAGLAQGRGVPLLDDLGSGALLDTAAFGLAHEPTVQESVAAGVGLVCVSGDKLLGGPQAGIVVGRRELVERLRRHPLARALRLDKATIAGLAATLQHYRRGEALEKVPVWRMISASLEGLRARANRWQAEACSWGAKAEAVEARSAVGGGSLPEETLPTWALAVRIPQPNALAARLRQGEPPVVARVEKNLLLLDPRTVFPEQDEMLLAALRQAMGS